MNKRTNETNELAVVSFRDTGDQIEVWPELFMKRTVCVVELTNAGRIYLSTLCADYCAEKISVDELLSNLQTAADATDSSYRTEVFDKLYFEFMNILAN
jgi:hypothetical protein